MKRVRVGGIPGHCDETSPIGIQYSAPWSTKGDGEGSLAEFERTAAPERRADDGPCAAGPTGWCNRGAQPPAFAREGHEHVLAASGTAHAGQPIVQNAGVEVPGYGSIDACPPQPEARLEALLPFPFDRFEPRLEKPIERDGLRLTRPIKGPAGSGRARTGGIDAPRPKRSGCSDARGPIRGGTSQHDPKALLREIEERMAKEDGFAEALPCVLGRWNTAEELLRIVSG